MEIFMMKRYLILIIHPQHQHHRHHQVTNNEMPLATCIVWGTLWYEVHLLMPGSLCQHEDFIHTIGLMVDQLLSIWTLFCCSLIVVLQIIMNIIFLTIAISVIYPVITTINMIFVTSQHQDWSLTTSWWLSDFFWHIPKSADLTNSYPGPKAKKAKIQKKISTILAIFIYPNDLNIARANYYFLGHEMRELFEIWECAKLIEGANYLNFTARILNWHQDSPFCCLGDSTV